MTYKSFDFTKLDPTIAYYHLCAVIAPRPIAWVSTRSITGVNNLAPFSFFNAFSADPPVVGFCPSNKAAGIYKDTHQNLIEAGECVINLVDYATVNQMNLTALGVDPEIDEFDLAKLSTTPSTIVKPPRVAESPVQIEARLLEIINFRKDSNGKTGLYFNMAAGSGAELQGGGNLVICELLCMHIRDEFIHDGRVDTVSLDLVGRNGNAWYTRANTDSMFKLERPTAPKKL